MKNRATGVVRNGRCKAGHWMVLLFCVWGVASIQNTFAQTEGTIRDAVLGKIPPEATMDVNNDNKVDVADLVKFLKPLARFEKLDSKINENSGTVNVRVHFNHPFSGILSYTVSGTAEPGVDYQPLAGSIVVNGNFIDIPVTINDDFVLETEETIIITLNLNQPDPLKLLIGMPYQHTVWIEENDTVWHGGIQIDGSSMGFEMIVKQSGSLFQAILESNGDGALPGGTWPVSLNITHDTFLATIGPIHINAGDTLVGIALDRTIVLEATPGSVVEHVIDLESAIVGRMTDNLESQGENKEYLQRVIEGTFTLIKESSRVLTIDPPLVTLP